LGGVSPDYAIVAQKHASTETLQLVSQAFSQEYGVTLAMLSGRYEQDKDEALQALDSNFNKNLHHEIKTLDHELNKAVQALDGQFNQNLDHRIRTLDYDLNVLVQRVDGQLDERIVLLSQHLQRVDQHLQRVDQHLHRIESRRVVSLIKRAIKKIVRPVGRKLKAFLENHHELHATLVRIARPLGLYGLMNWALNRAAPAPVVTPETIAAQAQAEATANEQALAQQGRTLIRTGSPYAVAPGRVKKGDGSAYRVYTPFYRAWLEHCWRAPAPATNVSWASIPGLRNEEMPPVSDSVYLPPVGEAAAHTQWQEFKESALSSYDEGRNRPDISGTSMLSAHLRWGEIHPRTLLAQLDDSPAHTVFRKEIAWREFYADVLHHAPDTARTWLNPKFEHMEYEAGPEADQLFEAWTQGKTGYPFVDAGMRQLLTEGWMHNRVRMVTASFLVKDLHLPWQRGASWFMKMLRDGDIASNQHGWQWVAGSGTDASPYFRIFNPVTQGLRFDPDGDYVRKYIPELTALPGKAAHEPWEHPLLSVEYPERIVDHAQERDESLRRYAAIGEDKAPLPKSD
jgi:deoxyribodipyrimidine photo-lyase